LLENTDSAGFFRRYNRLEVYTFSPEGIDLVASKNIYGRITMLSKVQAADSDLDQLFVGTDRCMFFTLSWNPETKQMLTTRTYGDFADKTARESQTGERCLTDPTKHFMTLEVYEGIITTLPLLRKVPKKPKKNDRLDGDPAWSRIPEFFVKSSAFIQRPLLTADPAPRIALLWEDHEGVARIKIRELIYSAGKVDQDSTVEYNDLQDADSRMHEKDELDFGASHLIPIIEEPYGLLVLGELSISYFDDDENNITIKSPLPKATIWVAWERIDNQRYVLADDYGELYLLMLMIDSNILTDWKLDPLGHTSRASCLIYLDGGLLFVGSHQGDSQVVSLRPQNLEVIQSLPNIAPILDFTVMDMGNRSGDGPGNQFSTGQARIVTGSGAWTDGSLRSVRSGVGVEELAVLGDMELVVDLFGLRTNISSGQVDSLLASFVNESRLFLFGADGDVEEIEDYKNIELGEQTLYAADLTHDQLVQVTTSSVRLLDLESGMVSAEWKPQEGERITAVSSTDRYLAISVEGVSVFILDLHKALAVHSKCPTFKEGQVACLALSPLFPALCFVGFWNGFLSILRLDSLSPVLSLAINEDDLVVPRSILLCQIFKNANPTLFVSLADGNVVTFDIDLTTYALTSKSSTILGTRQADLKEIPRGNGVSSVFASSEHPSLIYAEEERIAFSAVTADKVSCVCSFDSASFPGSIAIASSKDVRIGIIDHGRTTHVQTLPVGETTRRLAYSPVLKAFGIGTILRQVKHSTEMAQSSFQLADEVMFKTLDSYQLHHDELIEAVIRAELDDGYGQLSERFIVGTSFLDYTDSERIRGRILIFEVTEDRVLKIVTQQSTKGACRCLAMINGHIVAALVKTLVIYSLDFNSSAKPYLQKHATYRTATAPIDVVVTGNKVAVSDLMKSVSVLEYKIKDPANGGKDSFTEIARHSSILWSTALAYVAPETWLESDAEGNLVVLSRDLGGVTEEDRRRLRIQSEMCLGELVNRIRSIDVVTQPSAVAIPKAFLGTVSNHLLPFH
jgi:DNA damage-binding protein 1